MKIIQVRAANNIKHRANFFKCLRDRKLVRLLLLLLILIAKSEKNDTLFEVFACELLDDS